MTTVPTLSGLRTLFAPDEWAGQFELSVEHSGNGCHYSPIDPEAITRYCLIDPEKAREIVTDARQPTITLENYCFCGGYYRALTAFLFGDLATAPGTRTSFYAEGSGEAEPLELEISEEARAFWQREKEHQQTRFQTARAEGVRVENLNL